MSGSDAWRGFRYQALVLIQRLLDDLERARAAELEGRPPTPSTRYRLERPLDIGGDARAEGPDWDLSEDRDGHLIVDECKSGATLTPDDRRVLWRRVRRTVDAAPRADFTVRLTVADVVSNAVHWRAWDSTLVAADPSGGYLSERIASQRDAIAEARHWLVTADEKARPVEEPVVRRLLQSFMVEVMPARPQLVSSIVAALGRLSDRDVADALARWSEGLIATVATEGERKLDVATFCKELGLAERLFTIEPAVLAAWKMMRDAAASLGLASTPAGPLAAQPWRSVQPVVATKLAEVPRRMLLVGRGGLGKTTLLEQLAAERLALEVVVWLDDTTPAAHLGAALLLGAWFAKYRETRLLVLVDQLDEMDKESRDARLSAVVGAAGTSQLATVIATARDATAPSVAGVWERVHLQDWPDELVRRTAARPIPEHLGELLRTPLLLALWLDLRANASHVPLIADSVSVVGEWLARRVLPPSDARTPGRLDVLTTCAEHALAGRHTWELPTAEATRLKELLDLGVSRGEAGRYRFRHALLRDAVIVLAYGRDGAAGLARRLADSAAAYSVAFDALCSAFDAAFSPVGLRSAGVGVTWPHLLDASHENGLPATALIVQAAVPDAVALDVLGRVPLAELLGEAWVAKKPTWVRWLVSRPLAPRPSFVRRSSAASELLPLYYWGDKHAPDAELRRDVALRVRAWLRPGDGGLVPNSWQLTRIVAEELPDAETVRWLQSLGGAPGLFTSCFRKLADVPDELPPDALVDAFLASLDPCDRDDGVEELITIDDELGVLHTQPRAGMRLMFEMSARTIEISDEVVDDRWSFRAQEWESQWWRCAWSTFVWLCRSDRAYVSKAVEEAARSRSRAARLCVVELLCGTADEPTLSPLLDGRSARDALDEMRLAVPPAPPVHREAVDDDRVIFVLDDDLREKFGVGSELPPSSIGATVGDLVVRVGRDAERTSLIELVATWTGDGPIEIRRGRVKFIEGCIETASRVPADDLDLDGYAEVSLALWETWRRLGEECKHLGFQPELGWRLTTLAGASRSSLVRALRPLIDSILRHGSGMDLRGLNLDDHWHVLDEETLGRVVTGLIRRITDGPRAPHGRIKALEMAVQQIIDAMLDAQALVSAHVDALLTLVQRNPWLLETSRLRRDLLARARALRQG